MASSSLQCTIRPIWCHSTQAILSPHVSQGTQICQFIARPFNPCLQVPWAEGLCASGPGSVSVVRLLCTRHDGMPMPRKPGAATCLAENYLMGRELRPPRTTLSSLLNFSVRHTHDLTPDSPAASRKQLLPIHKAP